MQTILVGRVLLTKYFDCDFATEFHVFSEIDLAHAARAELFENPVM
jgi:hypothetical protein